MEIMRPRQRTVTLDQLVLSARQAGAPSALAEDARRVTAARFRIAGSAAGVSERARAYFWGIIRRRALRGTAPAFTDSMLALSLATELVAAGHAPDVVREEVARVYGEARAAAVAHSIEDGRAA